MASQSTIAMTDRYLPLNIALMILPTLPRPYLARLVANAIDLMDERDGDADNEPNDEPEQDDHGGGNVDDEGELFDGIEYPAYGIDQSTGPLSPYAH